MKIVLCGGRGVGKTTILRRLADQKIPETLEPNKCVSEVVFSVGAPCEESLKIHIWDFSAAILSSSYLVHHVCLSHVDAVIFVVDTGSASSLKDADEWIDLCCKFFGGAEVPKFLLVHKADVPERVVTAENLDIFVRSAGIDDWAFTVGSPDLCDLDHMRGDSRKQSAPADVIRRLVSSCSLLSDKDPLAPVANPYLHYMYNHQVDLSAYSAEETAVDLPVKYSGLINCPQYCIRVFLDPALYVPLVAPPVEAIKVLGAMKTSGEGDGCYADEGWSYFCGRMSRSAAEMLLHGFPDGTFFIRQSDLNLNYRVVVKESSYQVKHIEFKWRDNQCNGPRYRYLYRCGRDSLRGQEFESLVSLLDALDVNLQLGIVPAASAAPAGVDVT